MKANLLCLSWCFAERFVFFWGGECGLTLLFIGSEALDPDNRWPELTPKFGSYFPPGEPPSVGS